MSPEVAVQTETPGGDDDSDGCHGSKILVVDTTSYSSTNSYSLVEVVVVVVVVVG